VEEGDKVEKEDLVIVLTCRTGSLAPLCSTVSRAARRWRGAGARRSSVTAAQGSFARPPPSRACRLLAVAAIALRAVLSPRISASCAAWGRAR
jgi:hypothetical protein